MPDWAHRPVSQAFFRDSSPSASPPKNIPWPQTQFHELIFNSASAGRLQSPDSSGGWTGEQKGVQKSSGAPRSFEPNKTSPRRKVSVMRETIPRPMNKFWQRAWQTWRRGTSLLGGEMYQERLQGGNDIGVELARMGTLGMNWSPLVFLPPHKGLCTKTL